jgi:hypothetical protein
VLSFVNLRALAYWRMREWLDPTNGVNGALPPDRRLLAGLTAPRYTIQAHGVALETKKDVVKRLGWSPDEADAAVMALIGMPVEDGAVEQIEVRVR